MRVAIINESTLVDEVDAAIIVEAERHALSVFAGQWDIAHPTVEHARPGEEATEEGEPHGCVIVLLDDADQAGALGYHATTPTGQPYAKVFVRDSIADLAGLDPATLSGPQPRDLVLGCVAPVVDHEGKEALLDPDAADFVDDGNGTLWAKEACDAVESTNDSTDIALADGTTLTVTLSDHLLPAYFEQGAPGPWDHSGVLTSGFSLAPGGYAIVETAGQLKQVFGDEVAAARRHAHEAAFLADPASPATATRTGWRRIAHDMKQSPTEVETLTHPEPTPVGHGIVQDNVTVPGEEQTLHVTSTLGANDETDAAPEAPADTAPEPAEATETPVMADAPQPEPEPAGLHHGDERLPSDQVQPGEVQA